MRCFEKAVLAVLISVAAISSVWAADPSPVPGTVITVDAKRLPAPYATRSQGNSPEVVTRVVTDKPVVPPGFRASLVAERLLHARWPLAAPNGDIFLAQGKANLITLLRDVDGDRKADKIVDFATGFDRPTGMAIHNGGFYVADLQGIWRADYRVGDELPASDFKLVTPKGAFGAKVGHWTRTLAFSKDGTRMAVGLGSYSNLGEDPAPYATVQVFESDGRQRTLGSGLRNPVGVQFHPETDVLYTVVNERDGLGDGLVPDFFTSVNDGDFFGWPYSYIGQSEQPQYKGKRPDLVAKARVPDVLFQAHSAPLGLAFYDKTRFPEKYRGGAFVALHGSWNAGKPRGYTIAFIPFKDGKPAANAYEVFASGFQVDTGKRGQAQVWGRPCGLAVTADGGLLIADDAGGTLWQIDYVGR